MSLPLLCAGILLHFLGDYSLNLMKDDVVGGDYSHIVQKKDSGQFRRLEDIRDISCCKATFMCSVIKHCCLETTFLFRPQELL